MKVIIVLEAFITAPNILSEADSFQNKGLGRELLLCGYLTDLTLLIIDKEKSD